MRICHFCRHVKAKIFVIIDIGITQVYQHPSTRHESLNTDKLNKFTVREKHMTAAQQEQTK